MTINIVVAVAEGLVMAADSYSQMSDSEGVRATHNSVEKLTEIGNRQIAVMVNGLGSIANRTILSLIREFEFQEYSKATPPPIGSWTVTQVAETLAAFIQTHYDTEFPAPATGEADSREDLGIVVGGFSPGEFFPEVVTIAFPPGTVNRELPPGTGPPSGGWYVDFWGVRTALKRLLFGYDLSSLMNEHKFLEFAKTKKEEGDAGYSHFPDPPVISPDVALRDFAPLETIPHRLDGMPLQEAAEFADYLGMVAIGYDKFTSGPPSVGGELDVLAIQPEGLSWYRRKAFAAKMAEARERRNERP